LRDDAPAIIDYVSYFSDRNNGDNTWQRSADAGDKWIFALSGLGSTDIGKANESQTPAPHVPSTGQPSNTPILSTGKSNNYSHMQGTWSNRTFSNEGDIKTVFIDVG
jgi:hypothetical protein